MCKHQHCGIFKNHYLCCFVGMKNHLVWLNLMVVTFTYTETLLKIWENFSYCVFK